MRRRLRRDERGNVLIITAASMFLLIGMGGGALDISRLYLVKSRLQQACDAGVLAYRRSMNGTNVVQPSAGVPGTYVTASKYFYSNFAPGLYGTTGTTFPEPTVDANVVVHAQATTTLPMALMQLFGVNQRTLSTACDAQLQLPNTDVMFVLDTTGSMTKVNSGDTVTRISALRTAVTNFYNTLENAKIAGTQVRYGFVPYSNTVNVGLLLKREWMADSAWYQSRVFDTQTRTPNGTQPDTTTTYSLWLPAAPTYTSDGDPENCVAPSSTTTVTNQPSSAFSPASGYPQSRTNYRTVNGSSYSAGVQADGTCKITETRYDNLSQQRTETVNSNPNAGQTTYAYSNFWNYQPKQWNVSVYKGSAANGLMAGSTSATFPLTSPASPSSGTAPTATVAANKTVRWDATNGACIEERKTLRPGDTGIAWDMDIDSAPTTDPDTQWKPYLPGLVYARSVTNYAPASPTGWSFANVRSSTDYVTLSNYTTLLAACPSPARKLMTKEAGLTASALQTYLNALATRGVTYHDIGFLWGLRLISKEGLFGAENTAAPNGSSISRNIIFMTDGTTETHFQAYDAYGLSALDQRRTVQGVLPTDAQQDAIVEDRLTRYCNVAKNQKGITVWVIAFGDDATLSPLLTNCASSGRAFRATNAAQLNATFADIAAKIAQLRLTR